MFLNGQKVDFKGPKDAQEAGIAAVYQHPTSYPHLTVAENIFMGHEIIKHHMIQWKEMNQEANKYLKELDADFDATAEMGTLSVAQQQMVEIAKALSTNAKIIILDEPTAALTRNESEKLYTLVDKLKENGVSIIFISHRFEDMYRLASRVTVFRDSQYIGTYDVNGITNADLIKQWLDVRSMICSRSRRLSWEMRCFVSNIFQNRIFQGCFLQCTCRRDRRSYRSGRCRTYRGYGSCQRNHPSGRRKGFP